MRARVHTDAAQARAGGEAREMEVKYMALTQSGQAAKAKMQRAARMQDALRAKTAYAENLRMMVDGLDGGDACARTCAHRKLRALERQLDEISDNLAGEIGAMWDAMDALSDPTAQAIIEMRYMLGWTWPKIAHEINYSERQAQRIHNKAIEEIKFESGC